MRWHDIPEVTVFYSASLTLHMRKLPLSAARKRNAAVCVHPNLKDSTHVFLRAVTFSGPHKIAMIKISDSPRRHQRHRHHRPSQATSVGRTMPNADTQVKSADHRGDTAQPGIYELMSRIPLRRANRKLTTPPPKKKSVASE